MFSWVNLNVISTLLRYVLTAAGTWGIATGMFEAEAWAEISAAIIALVAALWGAYESARNKVVTNHGATVVSMHDLPVTTQATVGTSAAVAKAK